MRKGLGTALAAGLAWLAAVAAAHADGSVTRATGCGNTIFAAGIDGYSVLSSAGADTVADGDQLTGDLDRIGHVTLYDKTAGHSLFAIVEEHGLDKSAVTQRISATCRSFLANTFTSGRVMRTRGCGNKIFVDTPGGIAVLDRMAGGIVAEGDTLTGNFNRAGRATVQDTLSAAELTVFVDDFGLSRSAAQRKIDAACR